MLGKRFPNHFFRVILEPLFTMDALTAGEGVAMSATTLAEVARKAGVSPATASRVLNGSARIPGPEIAANVRRVAVELGYVPNAQAQGLAKSSSGVIGLIVHDIADPYFAAIAHGVQDAARERNKLVMLATTGGTPAEEATAVAAFAAHRADAIILAGSRTTAASDREANDILANELDLYCRNDGQVAVIGRPVAGAGSPERHHVIVIPNDDLAMQLAGALAEDHRGPFLIVAGPEGLATSDDRVRGFQRGLHAAGAPAAEILHTGLDRAGGHATGAELAPRIAAAHRAGTPACLFAVSDVMAIGLVAGLRDGGVQVPRDASVAGFDDIETLRDFHPGLTTVRLPLLHIGRIAVESTVALPGGTAGAEPTVTGELVLRRSTTSAALP